MVILLGSIRLEDAGQLMQTYGTSESSAVDMNDEAEQASGNKEVCNAHLLIYKELNP